MKADQTRNVEICAWSTRTVDIKKFAAGIVSKSYLNLSVRTPSYLPFLKRNRNRRMNMTNCRNRKPLQRYHDLQTEELSELDTFEMNFEIFKQKISSLFSAAAEKIIFPPQNYGLTDERADKVKK